MGYLSRRVGALDRPWLGCPCVCLSVSVRLCSVRSGACALCSTIDSGGASNARCTPGTCSLGGGGTSRGVGGGVSPPPPTLLPRYSAAVLMPGPGTLSVHTCPSRRDERDQSKTRDLTTAPPRHASHQYPYPYPYRSTAVPVQI